MCSSTREFVVFVITTKQKQKGSGNVEPRIDIYFIKKMPLGRRDVDKGCHVCNHQEVQFRPIHPQPFNLEFLGPDERA